MADDFSMRNNLSAEIGDNASVVQMHNVHGDVLLMAGRKRSTATTAFRLDSADMRAAALGLTAIAAVLLVSGLRRARATSV
ncbi:hypothetical protein [Lentzea flava]|uniref:Uncharacterized protein n=1 Tax=Lentzea flava TaxID=103732 RepID=A0ABQ2UJC8_9PSEU|nr:hypothetical protein [Lentzea flava]MCP2199191.1 hypothetical protein [Lentzea flava]GGU33868.1 hypothetical protein GCM10010178_27560 [Lentzea flava]